MPFPLPYCALTTQVVNAIWIQDLANDNNDEIEFYTARYPHFDVRTVVNHWNSRVDALLREHLELAQG